MKFADKLFFSMIMLLTLIFTIFGIWMLSSYFQKTLNRETQQAGIENQMQQYLFEMTYKSMENYGGEYAIASAVDSATAGMEKNGSKSYIWTAQKVYHGTGRWDAMKQLAEKLDDKSNYVSGIFQSENQYYLLGVCVSQTSEGDIYLGTEKNITDIYGDRQHLLNQYRISLAVLLAVGGVFVYALSQYITKPVRALDRVAEEVAEGKLESRCAYLGEDEIGTLAGNFNHMADSLVAQMKEKELEAKQKEDFTAAFAHELKTPLTSIIGYADMLNTVELSEEEQHEAYFYIYNQGKRLESLSHKLLDLVSMEKQPLIMKKIPVKQLEASIRVTMRPIFEKKKIKGKIILEKGTITGDFELLLSLFYNLLDNACKAVEEGGFILMKGKVIPEGYEIKVVDNGRGIPQEEIGRITEAFYMVDKSRSRKEGGAGIGMTLCQKIISLHNGTMRISSKFGEGTVIQIILYNQISQKGDSYEEK